MQSKSPSLSSSKIDSAPFSISCFVANHLKTPCLPIPRQIRAKIISMREANLPTLPGRRRWTPPNKHRGHSLLQGGNSPWNREQAARGTDIQPPALQRIHPAKETVTTVSTTQPTTENKKLEEKRTVAFALIYRPLDVIASEVNQIKS